VNDIDKAGAFAVYRLNKALSSAGSGFTGGLDPSVGATSASYGFGCKLNVKKSNLAVLPNGDYFKAPFDNIDSNKVRLAPIIIFDGDATNGDVILSMSGSGGLSESITNITTSTNTSLEVKTTASLTAEDKVLLVSKTVGQNCWMDQVEDDFVQGDGTTTTVPLDGDYSSGAAATFSDSAVALNMGKAPQFSMYGVGENNTLFEYDLLSPAATGNNANPAQFIEGVFQMEAIYGVNNGAVGSITWQAPTGSYASATLLSGTAGANDNLQKIVAVRIAFIMRTNLAEKENVSSGEVKLFEGIAGLTQTISGLDRKYRYRVIEMTVPIRNALVARSG